MEAHGVRFIQLQFTDISGAVKGVTLPLSQYDRALETGVWFDGSAIEGFARVSESDMLLRPDADALLVIYELNGISEARLVCDVLTPFGERYGGAPRTALRQALEEAARAGYDYRVGVEIEFAAMAPGAGAPRRTPLAVEVARAQRHLLTILADSGVMAEARESSLNEGHYGLYIWPVDALRAADAVTTLRYALGPVARDYGLRVSLMPQATPESGSLELRVHQLLIDRASERNVLVEMPDASAPEATAAIDTALRRFMGGQLRHAAALAAVLAPGVNAYKRADLPWRVGWGYHNRYTMLRVMRAAPPDVNRVEVRGADPSCNLYLALAALLVCGLDGLRDPRASIEPVAEGKGDLNGSRQHLEALPASLREALDALAIDSVVRGALGPVISERYLTAGGQQWATYRREVTAWERRHYAGPS
jgi:glutamine synthetase